MIIDLVAICCELSKKHGPQNWWPVQSKTSKAQKFEIMVGALLTQQTVWENAEKAIANMIRANVLSIEALSEAKERDIQPYLRVSGFYRQKTARIIALSKYLAKNYDCDLKKLFSKNLPELRCELLSLDGFGKETADNILLYAGDKLVFPVDSYTFRVFENMGLRLKATAKCRISCRKTRPRRLISTRNSGR